MPEWLSKILRRRRPSTGPQFRYEPGAPHMYLRYVVREGVLRQPRDELISVDTPIFMIGSCFANEIAAFLVRNDVGVLNPTLPADSLPLFFERSREKSSWGEWDGRSNLQYYNTFSIRQEIERAAGMWSSDGDDVWEVTLSGQTLFQCPYRRRIFCRGKGDLQELTKIIDGRVRQGLMESSIVIITLGLTEVWRKTNDGRIACCEPGYCKSGGHAETEFMASTYSQNYENVAATLRCLREHFGPRRVVLTVSPVRLGRTFRDLDVVLANMESKSILRAVAGRITAEFDEVIYFPSYEMCALDPSSWQPDGRHVRSTKVDQIMRFFLACHGTDDAQPVESPP